MNRFSELSPAKVNVFLEVAGRRRDGFHNIDSVFIEIDMCDTITGELTDDGSVTVVCDADDAPSDDTNLAARAVEALRRATGFRQGVRLRIEKRIPVGGGFGGGSSNAAATLRAVNRMLSLGVSMEDLEALAAELGSDAPFFVRGGAARCRGRGEVMEPMEVRVPLELVVIAPCWGINTARAYAALRGGEMGEHEAGSMVAELKGDDVEAVARECFNRFESAVFAMEPRAGALHRELATLPFLTVRLTGSGAGYFGIVPPDGDAQQLAAAAAGLKDVRAVHVARPVQREMRSAMPMQ